MPRGKFIRTEEWCKNLSEKLRGNKNASVKRSKDFKQKVSEGMKEYLQINPRIPEKFSMYNKHHSEDSKKKSSKAHIGNKSHFWKGGSSSEDLKLRGRYRAKIWNKAVKERDNYICQHCFKKVKGRNCCAHHIKDWDKYPELRYDVDNGLTLCRSCHTKLHNQEKGEM